MYDTQTYHYLMINIISNHQIVGLFIYTEVDIYQYGSPLKYINFTLMGKWCSLVGHFQIQICCI